MTIRQSPTLLAFDQDWFLSLMKMEKLRMKDVAAHLKIDATLLTNTVKGLRRMKTSEAEALSVLFKAPLKETFFRCGLNEEGLPDLSRGTKNDKEAARKTKVKAETAKVGDIIGYRRVSSLNVVSNANVLDSKIPKKLLVKARAFLTRNECIQLMCQSGGEISYPKGLSKGLHYTVPSEQIEVFACAVASFQFEQTIDRLLELHAQQPTLSIEQLAESMREEVAELAYHEFSIPILKE